MRLKDKVAVVTGGSHGIGRATSLKFAAEGAKVAVTGIDEDALRQTAQEIRSAGGKAISVASDVRIKGDAERMIEEVACCWGAVHVLVNNAGICEMKPFLEITEEEWDRHLDVNLKGAFLVAQTAAKKMVEYRIRGSIIHMSSVNGIQGEANQAHYNASKGGMNLLMMSMAIELADYGIRVNSLCPGFIATRLTQLSINNPEEMSDILRSIPLKRIGSPEEIADAAIFLASEDSRYMTGHSLVVDGGQLIKLA